MIGWLYILPTPVPTVCSHHKGNVVPHTGHIVTTCLMSWAQQESCHPTHVTRVSLNALFRLLVGDVSCHAPAARHSA